MSKQVFEENLQKVLGLPDRPAFNAMIELMPSAVPFKDEMIEVLESIAPEDLQAFIDDPHPTELALAFKSLKTD